MKRILIATVALTVSVAATFATDTDISLLKRNTRPGIGQRFKARTSLPTAPNPFGLTQADTPQARVPYRPGYGDGRQYTLPGGNSVLCGAKVYSDKWAETDDQGNFINEIDAGFYDIQARPNGTISLVAKNSGAVNLRTGVKVGSTYYGIATTDYGETAYLQNYYASSMNLASQQEIDVVNVPSDLTYDPSTGNVYGCFYNDQTQDYDRFCSFSLYYGEATDLYTVERNVFAVAANADGEIYGIMGYTGWLVRLYHSAAESPNGYGYEYIGKTGFAPGYTNSMAFDDATGKLYWCANANDGYSALLEVNTTTGQAKEIRHFPYNETFAGIFARNYKIPDGAPAAPTDFTANYTAQGAETGTLCCTAPAKSYNGGTLSGNLTLIFSIDGSEVAQVENVAPGATAETPQLTFPAGTYTAEVFAANGDFYGAIATMDGWCGEDSPGPITDLTLTDNNGIPTLSWSAPATGAHGQWFNPEGLTYTIVRYPDLHTVTGVSATTWTDDKPAGMKALRYTVTAVNAKGESEPVSTSKLVFGDGYTIPFTEGFDTADDFDLWQVIDLNGNTTWVYDTSAAAPSYSYGTEVERVGDDWLISPKFELEGGVTYALTFSAKSRYKNYKENFRFCLGTAPTPEAMTQTLCERIGFDNPSGYKDERVLFTPDADGTYYLGLYCFSPAHNWTLWVDNIGIMKVSAQVPAPVSDLTVTPGAQGAITAEIAFKAPATYASGDPMAAPVNLQLMRSGTDTPVKAWNDVEPGTALTFDDNVPASGTYTYTVKVANTEGEGEAAEASAFIGEDLPGPVQNLRLSESADGKVTLTWDAPTAGANGGWFNPDGLKYRIMRSNDAAELAAALDAKTFTDETLALTRQELIYYLVWPVTADGQRGTYNNTPLNVLLGPALDAPVTETFPAADMTLYPWTDESDGSVRLWTLENQGINPACADQNGDRGLAMCIATAATKGLTGSFLSPKISLAGLSEPQLSYWFYHSPSASGAPAPGESMTVQISADHGEFTDIEGSTVYRDNGTTGWRLYKVDLTPWKDAGFVRIAFKGKSEGQASMYIDNIRIGSAVATDAEVTSVTGPSRFAAGTTVDYKAIVSNLGNSAMNGAMLSVTLNGAAVSPQQSIDLPAGASVSVTLPVTVDSPASGELTVTVSHADDTNSANNTGRRAIAAVEPLLPSPDGLTALSDGLDVTLTWNTPAANPAVTDNIESYADYAIDGIGDYLMVDRDWDNTYAIQLSEGTEYPNMHTPKSFQVLDSDKLGISIWSEGQPHSGTKFLGCLASINRANDDWMISPRLNGAEQTIEFWAKSMTTQDIPAERMRVLYSTGSTDPDDFVAIHSEPYIELPDEWTCYRFVVPEGARYFAINCVSQDAFVLMVDDLAYNDLTVLPDKVAEYRLYRNGELIATIPATEGAMTATATDALAAPGKYTYKVRAIYGNDVWRETVPTEITVAESGLSGVDTKDVTITAARGAAVIGNAAGQQVRVCLPDGRTVCDAVAATAETRIPLAPGLYIVTAGRTHTTLLIP